MLLYPRLPFVISRSLALAYANIECEALQSKSGLRHEHAIFAATGGHRVDESHLSKIQSEVRSLARTLGFPSELSTPKRQEFDSSLSIFLHQNMNIVPSEAAKDEIWQFLTCVVLPDIVRWRFRGSDGTHVSRFMGGIRNTFQRLWWRAEILRSKEGTYELLTFLNEDELVQIMERRSLAGDTRLTHLVCKTFRTALSRIDISRMDLMRDAQKRLVRLASFISFPAIEDRVIEKIVGEIFQQAAENLAIKSGNMAVAEERSEYDSLKESVNSQRT